MLTMAMVSVTCRFDRLVLVVLFVIQFLKSKNLSVDDMGYKISVDRHILRFLLQ